MSGDVVNLRRERKRRQRDAAKTAAAENRVQFGRTRSERDETQKAKDRDDARHEAHKRDRTS